MTSDVEPVEPDDGQPSIDQIRAMLEATPVITEWEPSSPGEFLAGVIVRVEHETITKKDGSRFDVDRLIIDDVNTGRYIVKVSGRTLKAWFDRNKANIASGTQVGIRFDKTDTSSSGAEFPEYTVVPPTIEPTSGAPGPIGRGHLGDNSDAWDTDDEPVF